MLHHEHSHPHPHSEGGEARLGWSILLNLIITLAEILGGIFSGSLALLSDALHNFNDTASLGISLVALRISKRKADQRLTYGYSRAEIIGAFINLITLVLIAFFLVSEAIQRYFNPQPIDGLIMFGVAVIGLIANLLTAGLLHRDAAHSLNIRSAFIHVVSDALSSVAVVIGGILIIRFQIYIIDTIITLLISAYILFHSFRILRQVTGILMQGVPEHIEVKDIVQKVREVEGVEDMHHVHIWQMSEDKTSLEAHIVINHCNYEEMRTIKSEIKQRLEKGFAIFHSTLEFEFTNCESCTPERCYELDDHYTRSP